MHEETQNITDLVLTAARKAREETSNTPEPELTEPCSMAGNVYGRARP